MENDVSTIPIAQQTILSKIDINFYFLDVVNLTKKTKNVEIISMQYANTFMY